MGREIVYSVEDFVEVSYRADLGAIVLKWFSEYDEGTGVKDAVLAALDFVRAREVRHWIADVSTSRRALSEADYAWVSGEEFRAAISGSPLEKFVLVPPLPETGQDTSWVREWEANTLAKFGGRVSAKVCDSLDEARLFFQA